jgi:hypothetical protein
VIKVTNRALLAKFEESLLNDVDENDYINNKLVLLIAKVLINQDVSRFFVYK